jgi:hypothetical protein
VRVSRGLSKNVSRRSLLDNSTAVSVIAPIIVSRMCARRMTETMAELSGEMGVIAKPARIGDFAQRLCVAERSPATHKARCMIQPQRINHFRAGRTALREQFLQITERDSCPSGHLQWTQVWIGIALPDNAPDAVEHLSVCREPAD